MDGFSDLWSLLTGLASILGLVFTVGDRFAAARPYVVPLATGFGGFALGRLSITLVYGVGGINGDAFMAGWFIVFFCVLFVVVGMSITMLRHQESWYAYMIFLFGFMFLLSPILKAYSESREHLRSSDYLTLAASREHAGDLGSAIDFLRKAEQGITSASVRKELDDRIDRMEHAMADGLGSRPKDVQ